MRQHGRYPRAADEWASAPWTGTITDAIGRLRADGMRLMEADPKAEDSWVAHVNEVADSTLLPRANSWYVGANVPGKPRIFMPYLGGVGAYRQRCDEVAARNYDGFQLVG
jgi:cyclohexanone monooxygenase